MRRGVIIHATVAIFICSLCLELFSACQSNTLSEERIMELFWCIPDHGLNDTARRYMTEELYSTIDEAYSIPHGEGVGDEEFLYYFIHGNGGRPEANERKVEIIACSLQDDTHAEARIRYQYWGDKYIHILTIVKENGQWILDDFDGQKMRCKNYSRTHY